ncbi:hypothetical protein N7452_003229 [Penicillium brevicompactum]|uniref:Uncharacterized protein n=1 Tax=Penicillium brevicompactum TaxID=5074 RepID=A0A9W9QT53_PENBR|nr:hypothetical protein N7452_003229 [Penicillium brevicompactum]
MSAPSKKGAPLEEPVLREQSFCMTCLRVAPASWKEGGFGDPLLIPCYVTHYNTKSCGHCLGGKKTCLEVPAAIVGHRFELLAILSWVQWFWINDKGEFGVTEYGESVRELHFGLDLVEKMAAAIIDLIIAFDNFVKSHNANHSLTGTHISPASVKSLAIRSRFANGKAYLRVFVTPMRCSWLDAKLPRLSELSNQRPIAGISLLVGLLSVPIYYWGEESVSQWYAFVKNFFSVVSRLVKQHKFRLDDQKHVDGHMFLFPYQNVEV